MMSDFGGQGHDRDRRKLSVPYEEKISEQGQSL